MQRSNRNDIHYCSCRVHLMIDNRGGTKDENMTVHPTIKVWHENPMMKNHDTLCDDKKKKKKKQGGAH